LLQLVTTHTAAYGAAITGKIFEVLTLLDAKYVSNILQNKVRIIELSFNLKCIHTGTH